MKTLMISMCAALAACACVAQDAPKPAAEAPKPVAAAPAAKDAAQRPPRRPARGNRALRPPTSRIRVTPFGTLKDGTPVNLYRLQGAGGLILDVSDYGGRLVRCYAPDKFGNLADVTLGWNTPGEYETLGFSMGTLIGRFGNRIADGKFKIDDTEYQLPINEEKGARHCNLHGGPEGWDKKVWKARPINRGPIQGLELTYFSKDGEMGFPGNVTCKVTYMVRPDNTWTIDYRATTDKPTVLNLTHHSYWNLAGESSGNVLGQELKIFADEYTQTTAGLIPTKNAPVKGTGFDFTEMRPIGAKADWMKAEKSLAPMDNWYDHNFVLRGEAGKLKQAVAMRDPVSGRTLEIWTTEPCMQMYGAQNVTDKVPAKAAGKTLCQYAGVALETQHAPDSPNHPEFPSTVLRPGQTFKSHTEYRFGVSK
ncbi:MAG: aldose epimerase family protein [Kiritimatiellia bacterium]